MKPTSPDEVCGEVVYLFDDDDEDIFIDSLAVSKMLDEAGVTLKGKKMGNIDMREIERVLMQNPFVTMVDCYGNNNGMEVGTGRVCIRIKQMVPVLLVFDNKYGRYYVDKQGCKIKTDSIYAKNILVANGDISGIENKNRRQVQESSEESDECWSVWGARIHNAFNDIPDDNFIADELTPFANCIRNDEFWNSQIEQIFVEYNKNHDRIVTLIPRVGDQRIFMGTLDKYDKKLSRLRKFYERGLSVVGWNKYSILNLEFDNQVVGIIRGKEPQVMATDSGASAQDSSDKDETKKKEDQNDKDVKKAESKKEEPKKAESKKEEPKKAEPKKEDSKKTEPKKEDSKKAEPKKEESKKTEAKKS